jgi:hypothetical protein
MRSSLLVGLLLLPSLLFAEGWQGHLANRHHTGAWLGGLLGGAVAAHPLGLLVGGVGGYWLGKSSYYSDDSPLLLPPETTFRATVDQLEAEGDAAGASGLCRPAAGGRVVPSLRDPRCFYLMD